MAKMLTVKEKEMTENEIDKIVMEYLNALITATVDHVTIDEMMEGINKQPDRFEDGKQKVFMSEEELINSLIRIISIKGNKGIFRFSQIEFPKNK